MCISKPVSGVYKYFISYLKTIFRCRVKVPCFYFPLYFSLPTLSCPFCWLRRPARRTLCVFSHEFNHCFIKKKRHVHMSLFFLLGRWISLDFISPARERLTETRLFLIQFKVGYKKMCQECFEQKCSLFIDIIFKIQENVPGAFLTKIFIPSRHNKIYQEYFLPKNSLQFSR